MNIGNNKYKSESISQIDDTDDTVLYEDENEKTTELTEIIENLNNEEFKENE